MQENCRFSKSSTTTALTMQFKLSLATIAVLVAAVVAFPAVSTIRPCLVNTTDFLRRLRLPSRS